MRQTQFRRFFQTRRQGVQRLHAADQFDVTQLPYRGVYRFLQIGRLAIDHAVDLIPHIFQHADIFKFQ